MTKIRVGLSLLASLGVLMMACGDSGSDEGGGCETGEVQCGPSSSDCIPEADGSLAWVQSEVFDVHSCAASGSCHNGTNPDPRVGFDLSDEAASFDSLVNVPSEEVGPKLLVAPNDVDGSYLVNKLTGEGMAPNTQLMPLGTVSPLCDAKIDGVRAWINAGATP
jgi:hypothetical protein